jgi:uncharacterized Zn finger protein
MGRWDWDGYERTRPLPADGIKAKTQKGKFGKTWWAGRWLAALERVMDSGRLSRGRSYARSGQVLNLEVSPGGVSARVQGSRQTPYRVSIHFQALTDEGWEGVVDAIAEEAIYAARLLAGEMPEDIEEVFEAAGVSLFPDTAEDLESDCSCPDWANPCKHVAAVYYLLGERFDADPFLILALRGRTKETIIDALRARRSQISGEEEPALPASAGVEEEEPSRPLSASLNCFWSAPGGLPDPDVDFTAPEVDALPVKRLGPPPFWRSKRDFAELMEQAYRAIAQHALELALEEARQRDG